MKVSLNIIKQYIDFDLPPVDELVARINAQLGGVEEVIDLAAKYKDAKIVRVVECEKHANADKLSVCMVDAGTGELVQVVCGANNVHADMWAVWLPPNSTVPATFSDEDPFVLGARELRGVMSNGMLASARELAIGDDHDGIVEITEADVPEGKALTPGASFAEVFGLDDYVVDIENKMFTHRPDLFGQLGVAREIAGIFGRQFTSPEWYRHMPQFQKEHGLSLEIFNDTPDKASRFMAVAMSDITVKPSPLWLKCALVAMGGKPINAIVDATNYIMLVTAQPVHAYDYDKIRGARLGVRMAKKGEKLPLLNGKTYELTTDDIVIADSEGAIGLAGIMGGGNSEVSADTKNIVLEVANFDMYTVRKSSMRYGLFTDALTRFNKGQSPHQNPVVLAQLMDLIDGQQASEVFDVGDSQVVDEGSMPTPQEVRVTSKFINQRLGINLDQQVLRKLLNNVEIDVDSPDDHDTYFEVYPPFWRTDLEVAEDIVEEVGRLYGYDKLPRELPMRSTRPTKRNQYREVTHRLRQSLARAGANEVLTYSFVHERTLRAAGEDSSDAYQLSNALSPDLQYYRLSLTPSLLDKVHTNIKAGHDEFALFEIGKTHGKKIGLSRKGLPLEPRKIALVYAAKTAQSGAAYYQAKRMLDYMAAQMGLSFEYVALERQRIVESAPWLLPGRSAQVIDKASTRVIGVIGEYVPSVQKTFKLPKYSAGFELSADDILVAQALPRENYQPLGRYPSVERDISLRVDEATPYAKVLTALEAALAASSAIRATIKPLDIYQPEDGKTKNLTFRITILSHQKTLTSEEVNTIIVSAARQLQAKLGAEVL